MSQVHPFTFFVAPKPKQQRTTRRKRASVEPEQQKLWPLKIHQRRDLGAAMQLMDALRELGFHKGEEILNFPPDEERDAEPLLHVDLSFVTPGDFLLQTTRPPLDDLQQGARKRVRRGFTDVEQWTFEVWRRYFDTCARLNVMLAPKVGEALPKAYANRKSIEFGERTGAPYKRMNALDGSRTRTPPAGTRTAAFFLRVDEAWSGGPGLIAAFGMDGTSTFVWAYRLARDFRFLLEKPGFTMVEMTFDDIPKRPTDMRWARDWKIKVLIDSVL